MRKENLDHLDVANSVSEYGQIPLTSTSQEDSPNYRRRVSNLERVNKELGIKMDNT